MVGFLARIDLQFRQIGGRTVKGLWFHPIRMTLGQWTTIYHRVFCRLQTVGQGLEILRIIVSLTWIRVSREVELNLTEWMKRTSKFTSLNRFIFQNWK
jgi:hypothetical protein